MTEDPYHPEPPFTYECVECEERFRSADLEGADENTELVSCPECGGEVWNLTTPSRE